MATIETIHGRQVLDSRGNPTVEVEVVLDSGARGLAAVPSGASTGEYEAVELRDGGDEYGGKAVGNAVSHVNGEIADALKGAPAADQPGLDRTMIELDGTPNKGRLGANAILGVSLASAKAAAAEAGQPLYDYFAELYAATGAKDAGAGRAPAGPDDERPQRRRPCGQRGGLPGVHGGSRGRGQLRRLPADRRRGLPLAQGNPEQEGAFDGRGGRGRLRARSPSNQAALDFLIDAIEEAGYAPGVDVMIALDPATSEFFEDGKYVLEHEGRTLSAEEMADYWHDIRARFPVVSIEDGMDEEDWDGWKALTERIGDLCQLVGDDNFVTNPERLQRGIDLGVANSILVKLNQIGTLTETLETIRIARDAGYTTVISHRSGETEDTTIADLAVGTCAGQIKTGAPSRSDRVAKYNRLLRIEEQLGDRAKFPGSSVFDR